MTKLFSDDNPDNKLNRRQSGGRNEPPKGPPPEDGGPSFNWQKTVKTMAFWAIIVLLSFWAFNYYFGPGSPIPNS
jgi:hypothetical protein